MKCLQCNQEVSEKVISCWNCDSIVYPCIKCGKKISTSYHFCIFCGNPAEKTQEISQLEKLLRNFQKRNKKDDKYPEIFIKNREELYEIFFPNIEYYLGIRVLICAGLGLSEISKEIYQLKNLECLDLSRNQFTHFPREIFELKALRDLNISENCLDSIPNEITHLENLEGLNLRKNAFSNFPDAILHLKKLEYLNLLDNQIKVFPQKIQVEKLFLDPPPKPLAETSPLQMVKNLDRVKTLENKDKEAIFENLETIKPASKSTLFNEDPLKSLSQIQDLEIGNMLSNNENSEIFHEENFQKSYESNEDKYFHEKEEKRFNSIDFVFIFVFSFSSLLLIFSVLTLVAVLKGIIPPDVAICVSIFEVVACIVFSLLGWLGSRKQEKESKEYAKEVEKREKIREVEKRTWLYVSDAIKKLLEYHRDQKIKIHPVCLSLFDLLNLENSKHFNSKVREKIRTFAKEDYISRDNIEELLILFALEFKHINKEGINALLEIVKDKEKFENFLPTPSVQQLVNLFVGKYHKNHPWSQETCRKIEIILNICSEKPGEKIPKEKIKELWREEEQIDKYDDFDDDRLPPVMRILKGLSGKKKGERQLKEILQFDEKHNFHIDKKDEAFVKEFLVELKNEQQRLGFRIKGEGVLNKPILFSINLDEHDERIQKLNAGNFFKPKDYKLFQQDVGVLPEDLIGLVTVKKSDKEWVLNLGVNKFELKKIEDRLCIYHY